MAKIAKGEFSCAAIEETQCLIKTLHAGVRAEKTRVVEFAGHRKVKAAIEGHPAMFCENHTDSCLPCQTGTVMNPQTCWWCKGTGAPQPDQLRQPTPEPTPTVPRTPSAPPGNVEGAQGSETSSVPAGHANLPAPLPNAQFVNLDAYAKDSKYDKDFIPDSLTDRGPSTG